MRKRINLRRGAAKFFRHRQHPLKLIDYTSKNLWLLLIPISKYLIASKFNFEDWIRTNWVDILTITGIFVIAVLRWTFVTFDIDRYGIVANTGLFGMVKTKVYYSEITTVSLCQGWLNRPVKAYSVYVETNARTVSREDIKLLLSQRNAELLFEFAGEQGESPPRVTFSPRKAHLLIFSLIFSSAFSGMILYGTFMFEAYQIVGLELEREVVERLNGELTRLDRQFLRLSETLPQAVLILGGVVILGWFLSFITTFARHWSFTVSRTEGRLFVNSGVLIKRRHIINRDKVNYYDITDTLLMKLFRICSVTLDCTGYGKSRREISALIPITTYRQMNASLKLLVPDLPKARPEIKTTKADIRRFVAMPLVLCAIPPTAVHFIKSFFGGWTRQYDMLVVIMMIPLVWLVAVKAAAAMNTSIGFNERGCTMSYCRLYQFHKVLMPKENISKIRITRNPFQLRNGRCTLSVYTVGEKQKRHKMKFMPYDEIKNICMREGYILFE